MTGRSAPLLMHLGLAGDAQRLAVGPALAAVAARAGWAFESYADERRRGRHYGGGDPAAVPEGWAAGSLVAGGGHVEQALWLASAYDVTVVGDPRSLLWPVLEAAGGEMLAAPTPAALYRTVFDRLGEPLPDRALVVDASPQGPFGLVVAPYLYPEFLDGPPVLGVEVSAAAAERAALEALGVRAFEGRWLDPGRGAAFGPLAAEVGRVGGDGWAALTTTLAERHRGWGQGFLLGDPGLVGSQLGRAAARRLLPLYSQPQTEVIKRAAPLLEAVGGTVFGRQYDDHDFFELAPLGHGLQLVDPGPPFESLRGHGVAVRSGAPRTSRAPAVAGEEVSDEQLRVWADEGRVLTTLLFWSGMVRELECVPRIVDLVATTGLRSGLVLTAAAVEQSPRPPVTLLAEPLSQGGVEGALELLLGSMGSAVAPEALLPPGVLQDQLESSLRRLRELLPAEVLPRGWWPILDAPLSTPSKLPVRMVLGRPVVRLPPRRQEIVHPHTGPTDPASVTAMGDLRSGVGVLLRRLGAGHLMEQDRPFSWRSPLGPDPAVAKAVAASGFSYMWSKAGFGSSRLVHRDGDFVSVPLTAGVWGGWTPFYTVDSVADLVSAEKRLTQRPEPGWLAGTIDSPLWLDSGELFARGAELFRMAEWLTAGGRTGRLVNVTPAVVARYARLLDDRAAAAT